MRERMRPSRDGDSATRERGDEIAGPPAPCRRQPTARDFPSTSRADGVWFRPMSGGLEGGQQALIGRWIRAGEPPPLSDLEAVPFGQDPAMLPGEIEFTATRFRASKAPGQGFTVWDVGSYRVGDDGLAIGLANDDTATYPIEIGDDEFTVTDQTGTRTTYRRRR